MFVQGVVNLNRDGTAQLTLQPARQVGAPPEGFERRPTAQALLDQIRSGQLVVHGSRAGNHFSGVDPDHE